LNSYNSTLRRTYTIEHEGRRYTQTGKVGHVFATGLASREYEADERARIWVDEHGTIRPE